MSRATPTRREPEALHWLESAGGWVAAAIALAVTLSRVSEGPAWRDDLAVVRGLGFVPVGGEGAVSMVALQLASLVPIGGRLLRVASVSAVGVAITAGLTFELTRRLLRANAATPVLGASLALAAALMATLSPSWQLEGTTAGGAALAVALVVATLLVRPNGARHDARAWLAHGALAGLTFMESHAAGLAVLGALLVQSLVLQELPTGRRVGVAVAGAAVALGFCSLVTLLRPHAGRAWVDLGYDLVGLGLAGVDVAAERPGALTTWLAELGVVSLVLAGLAAVWGLARARTRWLVAPLVLFVVADVVFPAPRVGLLSADPVAGLRLLALVAMAAAAALGVHTVALGLVQAKVPLAQPAAVLLVVFDFTLALVTAEDSAYVANRRDRWATDAWTDEAFGNLPPRSLVLVRTEAIAWRLWAARVARGERADVVVVPIHLLGRGSVARRLLELEPALADVVRDVAITGRPGEYALSTLADVRPLFVELNPSWDERLHEHLVPGALWLQFAPQALGRSDRTLALEPGFTAFERARAVAAAPGQHDPATLAVLGLRARDQALALASLGDRESLELSLNRLELLGGQEATVAGLRHLMEKRKRGRLDIVGLLP